MPSAPDIGVFAEDEPDIAARWPLVVLVVLILLAATLPTVWGTPLLPGAALWAGLCAAGGLSIARPIPGAVVVGVLVGVAASALDVPIGMSVLATLVAVGAVAARGPFVLAAAVGLWYLVTLILATVTTAASVVDVVVGGMVWVLCIGSALAAGRRIHRALAELQEARERRRAELAGQRRALARELHDSAVRATSEIVLLAEAARYDEAIGPAGQQALGVIAERARHASGEIVGFMEELRRAEGPWVGRSGPAVSGRSPEDAGSGALGDHRADPERVWDELLERSRGRIVAAGFRVEAIREGGRAPDLAHQCIAERCLDELVANLRRHADPDVPVVMRVVEGADRVGLELSNGVPDPPRHAPRHAHGLIGVRERLAEIGGTLEIREEHGRFTARAVVPLRRDRR